MKSSNTADSKILILYLVKNAPGVSYQMLMDKCMESLYTDFFVFSECYNELIAGNLMDRHMSDTGTGEVIGMNEILSITKGGEMILNDLKSTLNKQVEGYLIKAASELREEIDNLNSIKAFSEPTEDNNYMVTLSTIKGGRDFTVSFKVSNEELANEMCKNWRRNSSKISSIFIDELLKS